MQQHLFRTSTKLALCCIIILLTSCAPQAAAPAAPAGEPAASPDWEVLHEPLRVAYAFDARSLDPACAHPQDVLAATVFNAVYHTLVTYDPTSTDVPPKIVPWLAESLPESSDGMEWVVKLRQDISFVDGTPVTADAVVYSIKRLIEKKGPPAFLADTIDIDKVEKIDDYTIKFTLTQPDPAFLSKLASGAFSIVNQKQIEEMGGEDSCAAENKLNMASAGSGAYTLKERKIGETIVLASNDAYQDEQAMERPQEVTIQIIPDTVQFEALKAGDIDVALNLTPAQVDELAGNSAFQIYKQSSVDLFALATNWNKPDNQTTDQRVQQAIRYAIDYDAILQVVGGAALTPSSFIPKQFPEANPEVGVQYDPAKAASLMAEAGYGDGNRLPVRIAYSGSTTAIGNSNQGQLAELIAENLKQVYFDVEVVGTAGNLLETNPDLVLFGKGANYLDALDYLDFLPGGSIAEWLGWKDDELAEGRLKALTTFDFDDRKSILWDLQQRVNDIGSEAFILQPGLQSAAVASLYVLLRNPQGFLYLRALKPSNYCQTCCSNCLPSNSTTYCKNCRNNCTNC